MHLVRLIFPVAFVLQLAKPKNGRLVAKFCRKDLSSSPNSQKPATVTIQLRNATIADLDLLRSWDEKEHLQEHMGDEDYNDWNWSYELPRQPSWRYQLIAECDSRPFGIVQIIDPLEEEFHYWGLDVEPNLRALDIWIGEEDFLGKGYGTMIMCKVLEEYCFSDPKVTAVLVDPMVGNKRAHRFYQNLGFRPIGERMFGPDKCLVHRLDRQAYNPATITMKYRDN